MGNIKKKLGRFGRRFINPSKWMSIDNVSKNAGNIKDTIKKLFVIPASQQGTETFQDVQARLKLSVQDLQQRVLLFKRFSLFFLLLSILMLIYAVYCFLMLNFQAGLVSVGIASALLGFAFKYHFWSFQFKQRKLGCTFDEWLHHGLLGRSKHKRLEN